jgi:Rieske Fe-S protein
MFVCPCHGGKYNADGRAVAGPPPYALKEHKVTEKDGKIKFAIS